MTDIVERLWGHPGEGQTVTEQFRNMVEQRHEAAAEIERLRAQLSEWRSRFEALQAVSFKRASEIERLRGIKQFAAEASRHERDGLRVEIERLRAALTPKCS